MRCQNNPKPDKVWSGIPEKGLIKTLHRISDVCQGIEPVTYWSISPELAFQLTIQIHMLNQYLAILIFCLMQEASLMRATFLPWGR
jgi:hypothetical protein